MKIIAFDIGGKMAHFRKYYANNTALSYTLPPRTTLMGLLAAMLGEPRDSYYEKLSSNRLRIGIRILSPLKKTFHRVNYLRIDSPGNFHKDDLGDFRGTGESGGRIQTPFEIVSGHDLQTDFVKYRVYLAANTEGVEIFEELEKVLTSRQTVYNLTLGVANFSASLIGEVLKGKAELILPSDDSIFFHSAVPSSAVKSFSMQDEAFTMMSLEEELLPLDFVKNEYRELSALDRFLFSNNGQAFSIQTKKPFYQIRFPNTEGVENIFFLEK